MTDGQFVILKTLLCKCTWYMNISWLLQGNLIISTCTCI